MSNQNLNPISRLLDIDFPDIKRSNWDNSFDTVITSDVGFVKPVFHDHVMAGSRCTLDFNSASFANATIAPLYGRYKVKYLAFWAPDRLYMADWLTGEKMLDDNYPYPYLTVRNNIPSLFANENREAINKSAFSRLTGDTSPYISPTSLAEYLDYFPAFCTPASFDPNDNLPNKNAFSFLAFWDAYRTFILNPQEKTFPVRNKPFIPSLTYIDNYGNDVTRPASSPFDIPIQVSELDEFFKDVKRARSLDVSQLWYDRFGFDPIWANKPLLNTDHTLTSGRSALLITNRHYGLPVATHLPDTYTSFISNENVELERSRSTVNATVNGDNATFTMEQWYLASRIQSKIRKNLYKFQDFSEWIDTNFGIKPSTTLTQPMFLGAFSSDIIFNDVISNVQQGENNTLESNRDLGSRAGYGVGRDGARSNFFDFTAKEPGTVMIVQYIVPEVFYFEGCDPHHDTLNFNEEFNPIFDALGFQDLGKATLNSVPNLSIDPSGAYVKYDPSTTPVPYSSYNIALAQQPYAFEHMAKTNKLHGQMVEPSYYQSWSLARSFNYIRSLPDAGESFVLNNPYSTYIIPEMYNNIFSNTVLSDNFQFYLSFNYKKYQPVSKQFLSFR